MSAMHHKMPPYSKLLARQLADPSSWRRYWGTSADGKHVSVWVITGPEAWRVAKDGHANIHRSSLGSGRAWEGNTLFLLLPPGQDPYAYDWRQLAIGEPILVAQAGNVSQTDIATLADALLRDGVGSVLADSPGGPIRYSTQRRAA